jgi:hypothetical protein
MHSLTTSVKIFSLLKDLIVESQYLLRSHCDGRKKAGHKEITLKSDSVVSKIWQRMGGFMVVYGLHTSISGTLDR